MNEIVVLTPPGDNYIYLVTGENHQAVAIDPGTAEPVMNALADLDCSLTAILITHNHSDHRGGVSRLVRETGASVWSAIPATEENLVVDGDILRFGTLLFRVIATPGHTEDSVCFDLESAEPHALFSGDTLFSGGCGRVFSGEPEELYHSLLKLADLNHDTRVYPGHDYGEENYRFALSVDPEHVSYERARKHLESEKAAGRPGVPVTIAEELRSNIFLRSGDPGIRHHLGIPHATAEEVFVRLRLMKNRF